jgi:hypothetical protein
MEMPPCDTPHTQSQPYRDKTVIPNPLNCNEMVTDPCRPFPLPPYIVFCECRGGLFDNGWRRVRDAPLCGGRCLCCFLSFPIHAQLRAGGCMQYTEDQRWAIQFLRETEN